MSLSTAKIALMDYPLALNKMCRIITYIITQLQFGLQTLNSIPGFEDKLPVYTEKREVGESSSEIQPEASGDSSGTHVEVAASDIRYNAHNQRKFN